VKGYCVNDVTEPKRGHKKNWTDDALARTTDTGEFDREFTIENREWLRKDSGGKRIAPNPPPKKVGKVDPKTIALAAVSDVIDCGSWKHAAVLRFNIDSANRGSGNCWPSEETVADKLKLGNTKAVSRANRWWRFHGCTVEGKVIPFLTLARKGRRRPDGTRESNAYHVGWIPLITMVANHHWNAKLRFEAAAVLASIKQERHGEVTETVSA
jgi:hypothetical protein